MTDSNPGEALFLNDGQFNSLRFVDVLPRVDCM